jgi:glycosyltransferase involved in cell wall biosynthesis
MKIVIAAWHLKDFNVGLGRYCRELIDALGRVDHESRYEILIPDTSYRFSERPNFHYRIIRFPVFKRRFWEQVAPLLAGKHDLLHFPYDSGIAWKRGKFIVTIHDVKPLIFGELRAPQNLNALIEGWLVGDKWSRIDHVLTDSECSRRDIIEHLHVPTDRITVVYPGVDMECFRPISAGHAVPPSRPYVLCVAGGDPTKNVDALIKSFARLPHPLRESHDLVLAGDFRRREDLRELVARAGLEKQTIFTGLVKDERLIDLYQQARLFVFPSRYEGFGLPVLEAMACGCPVITSNASSLPEVAGDAAIQVDPLDVDNLASAIVKVLEDDELRSGLSARGLHRARQFSWDRTARETIAVYKRVVGTS